MAFAGLKRKLNKTNQLLSEKMGKAKGTELGDDYVELERKIDITDKMVAEIISKTQEFLQPNPVTRVKLHAQAARAKVRRVHGGSPLYQQPEGTLGEILKKHGTDLGETSEFGAVCQQTGEVFKLLAEGKYTLEEKVKHNFLDPLEQLQSNVLQEIIYHRKKTNGRRLDYDGKRRKKDKGGAIAEEEVSEVEDKFADSKRITETAMYNLFAKEEEQIGQMKAFVEALADYHQSSVDLLLELKESLSEKYQEVASREKEEHVPQRVRSSVSRASKGSKNYNPFD